MTMSNAAPAASPRSMGFLARYGEIVFLILRVVVGLLFVTHGAQKLFGVLHATTQPAWSQAWIGGVIELVGGALVALGLFTRPAAFLVSGTMAVAYCQFHWKGAFDERFFPVINQGELALVYALLFLQIACVGGGRFSLDALRARR